MAEVVIEMRPRDGAPKLKRFSLKLNGNIKRALTRVGAILEGQIKEHLRTYVWCDDPGRRFPSLRSGRLMRSVTARVSQQLGGWSVKIGPDTVYAAVHEFGAPSKNIPKRPYVWPALEARYDDIVDEFMDTITRPLE